MSRLFWEIHPGNGPCLLLVHGFLSSRAQWRLNLEALSNECTPITVELFGHGRSPSPKESNLYSISSYVEELEQLRNQLNIAQWFVCGYSLGAAITIRYALTYPENTIGHVFTNSSSAFADDQQIKAWRAGAEKSSSAIRTGGMRAIEKLPVHPKRARRLPTSIYDDLVADSRLLDPRGIANTIEFTVPGASSRTYIGDNQSKALLVCGRFEKRFVAQRDYAAATMPNLSITNVDSGHAVNMQTAPEFNQAVSSFIKACL